MSYFKKNGIVVQLLIIAALHWPALGFAGNIVVRMQTAFGPIDIKLDDLNAPNTVNNFLDNYLSKGRYDHSFIHGHTALSDDNRLLGGQYFWDIKSLINPVKPITTESAIANEKSGNKNLIGTVAMNKPDNTPNGATSQWFINLANNTKFDSKNGGYAVFGTVFEKSMPIVNKIANLKVTNASSDIDNLTSLPITGKTDHALREQDLVMLNSVSTNRTTNNLTDYDYLFSFLELSYPEFLSPAYPLGVVSSTGGGYYYRHYAATDSYIAELNGEIYFLGPATNGQIIQLPSSDMLGAKIAARGLYSYK